MANKVTIRVGAPGAKQASSEIDQLRDKFSALQKQGAKGFAIGAGAAITSAGIGLVTQAIGELGNVAMDSIKAFNEDQASQQKLATSLKANIPAWDGNTDAIERVLAARMKLGFSDDEQRESLSILVAKTHDVTKALEIQRAAMDLARLKGIGLAEATKAISLGMEGSGRALKELGINVKDYASGQEILTAIQAKATGQAEAFAKTNEGKLLVSQVRVQEAEEKFGALMAGPYTDAIVGAADAVEGLASVLDLLEGRSADTTDAQLDQVDAATRLIDVLSLFNPMGKELDRQLRDEVANRRDAIKVYDEQAAAVHDMVTKEQADNTRVETSFESARGTIGDALSSISKKARDTAYDYATAAEKIRNASDATKKKLKGDADSLIDDAFDPLINYQKLVAANAEASAAKTTAAAKGATAAQKEAALEAQKTQAEFLLAIAGTGQANTAAYKTAIAGLKENIKNATGPTKAFLQQVYDKIVAIDSLDPNVTIKVHTQGLTAAVKQFGVRGGVVQDFSSSTRRRAKGGPVTAGQAYLVGENEPELFVPNQSGKVVPTSQTGGLSGSMTLNVTVNASPGMTPAAARDIGAALGPAVSAWMQRNGLLARGAQPLRG